ncbi:MAG: PAS domain-containing sensor histidine kinase [Ginsengibacter sp.]
MRIEMKNIEKYIKEIESIKSGNIDALIVNDAKSLKVYTENTADKIYRILIEKMNEGAVTVDADGTIIYCNRSFAEMINLPLEKVIGEIFKKFIDDSLKKRFEDLLGQRNENSIKGEIYLYSTNGPAIPVLMSINAFLLDGNFVVNIILTDLTVQKKNEEELKLRAIESEEKNMKLALLARDLQAQQAESKRVSNEVLDLNKHLEKRVYERTGELENLNRELKDLSLSKDKFLSVISHDLRNPLTALLISSDTLSQDTKSPDFDKVRPFIDLINRTSHNILKQLDETVEWAQMQLEKAIFNPEKIHLFLKVNKILDLLQVVAAQKNVILENKIPPDILVNADILMLRSVFQNLITNSIKYSLENGLVTITAVQVDNMIEIAITDTGIGMTEAVTNQLFSNIHSTSIPGTNNEKGTGLGLILVKDFVRQNGGTIRAESEPGKGTRIYFTLPVAY